MTETIKTQEALSPDLQAIRFHLDFLFAHLTDYGDGIIEICYQPKRQSDDNAYYFKNSFRFPQTDIKECAQKVYDLNCIPGQNVTVRACLLDPDLKIDVFPADPATSGTDMYVAPCAWVDIDKNAGGAGRIKELYKNLPPSLTVITGEKENDKEDLRLHLWFKFHEPQTEESTIREANAGLVDHFGGDNKCVNPTRLMRVGGTVAWPKKPGRVAEMVQVKTIKTSFPVSPEQIFNVYPVTPQRTVNTGAMPGSTTRATGSGLDSRIIDGRDDYMSRLVTACILSFAGKNGAWPTDQEVFDEAWPTYERNVKERDGVSLEQARRGKSAMVKKIRAKLRLFEHGRFPGIPTLESAVARGQEKIREHEEKQDQNERSTAANDDTAAEQSDTLTLGDWIASKRFTGKAPEIEWLIEGIMQKGIPCLLAAMGGLGKSFTVLDLCLEIAGPPSISPRRILGGQVPERGRCVFLTAEDSADSVHRRIEAVCTPEQLAATTDRLMVVPMPNIGGPRALISDGKNGVSATPFYYELLEKLKAVPDLKFIGIDPLQAFVGADITSSPEAAQAMWTQFSSMAALTGATFMATHHMRKEGAAAVKTLAQAREAIRGVTSIVDSCRMAYALWEADEDTAKAIAKHVDMEYETNLVIHGGVVKANDRETREITSFIRQDNGVLKDIGPVCIDYATIVMPAADCRAALEEIRKAWDAGKPFRTSPQAEKNIFDYLAKSFRITKTQARFQVQSWTNPPIGSDAIMEERSFKDDKRMTKSGLYVKRIPQ